MEPHSGRGLTHIDELGRAAMVDVGEKPPLRRQAVAEAYFYARPSTIDHLILAGTKDPAAAPAAPTPLPKGEALAVARVAGIQAAKRCDELIPLCHSLPLDSVAVNFERTAPGAVRIIATASTTAKTGVEMEAILAATIAAVTLYDMTKGVDRDLRIGDIRLVEKTKSKPSDSASA